MKRRFFILMALLALVLIVSACTQPSGNLISSSNSSVQIQQNNNAQELNISLNDNLTVNSAAAAEDFIAPINNAFSRITKKPFGLYVTPKNSPVQPEKFAGYHTGVDFETLASEADTDIRMTAGCTGNVRVRQWVSGYGGVLIQDCIINNQAVTVLYGHLNLGSITTKVGDALGQGGFIANLGKGNSPETDGERKHLHLGIHIGTTIDYKGYVNSQDQLTAWLDAQTFL